jgi:hypothetical protein
MRIDEVCTLLRGNLYPVSGILFLYLLIGLWHTDRNTRGPAPINRNLSLDRKAEVHKFKITPPEKVVGEPPTTEGEWE